LLPSTVADYRSMAYRELCIIFACIFREYDQESIATTDNQKTLELFQTNREDLEICADLMASAATAGTHGLQVLVRGERIS
jgi:hypothetical protein